MLSSTGGSSAFGPVVFVLCTLYDMDENPAKTNERTNIPMNDRRETEDKFTYARRTSLRTCVHEVYSRQTYLLRDKTAGRTLTVQEPQPTRVLIFGPLSVHCSAFSATDSC